MKVCAVELKANDAIVCILSQDQGLFDIPDCRVQKLSIADAGDSEQLKKFQFTFAKLVEDYKIGQVVIRTRPMKGKFAGGATGFKLGAALQLIEDLEVVLLSPTEIKASLKNTPIAIDFRDTGLKQYQETAFTTAFAYLNQ